MTKTKQASECDKLLSIQDKSQAIGEFLDWLQGQGVVLARFHEHTDACLDADGRRGCGLHDNELFPEMTTITRLLATYFQIDLDKVEQEKQLILQKLRCYNQLSCPRCQQLTTPDINGGHYCSFCQSSA